MNEQTQAEWKSPRKINEEIEAAYRQRAHETFERYMQLADEGFVERSIAIVALREDLQNPSQ